MQTITSKLEGMADGIAGLMREFLLKYTTLYNWNSGGFFVISGGDFAFGELSVEGRQLQSRLLEDYRRYYALLSVLLSGLPNTSLVDICEADKSISDILEQRHGYWETPEQALEAAEEALDTQIQLLRHLYDTEEGRGILVPDTNAFYFNPKLDAWSYSEFDKFTFALLPTVLNELDEHKEGHRNENVRKKAQKLIRQIKEYRRRGKLTDGVPIVKGKIEIIAIAIEPDMENTLEWLDPTSPDDRVLASMVELIRQHPRSSVVLVTRDINLQNKAELAGLPFLEPPEQEQQS
ncbi:MAG: hypothetical protein GY759_21175 [Chloroflexi bacterium]|nr:hypothetical protein [Chloroflexota bacterium]